MSILNEKIRVPKVINNWEVFIGTEGYIGICESLKLPDPEERTETVKGCGRSVEIEIPVGMVQPKAELKMLEMTTLPYTMFGIGGDPILVMLKGSMSSNLTSTVPINIALNGRFNKIETEAIESGKITRQTLYMNVSRYSMNIDSKPVVLMDVDKNIFNFSGVE